MGHGKNTDEHGSMATDEHGRARMNTDPRPNRNPRHISLVALPDAAVSTLFGVFDVFKRIGLMGPPIADAAESTTFAIEIVGGATGQLALASGVPITVPRTVNSITSSDLVIVPSTVLGKTGWEKGRYHRLVEWARAMHDRGAVLCSGCSGTHDRNGTRCLSKTISNP